MEHLTGSRDRFERLRQNGIPLYPARCRRTHAVAQTLLPGVTDVVLAGRLTLMDADSGTAVLADASGRIPLYAPPSITACWTDLASDDIVECAGTVQNGVLRLHELRLLVPSLSPAPETIPTASVVLRANMLSHIRRFFDTRGFIGVDTPTFMTVPDLTPALVSFRTIYRDDAGKTVPLYLQTSPEHYMKRLLAAGYERIYQLCRFYRNGERFSVHNPEFTGLEWYEAYTDSYGVMQTTQELVASMAVALNQTHLLNYRGRTIDLSPPWPRVTVRDTFLTNAGIDLDGCEAMADFREQAVAGGFETRDNDTWDDLFYRIFTQAVEPALPADRPVFVTEYPAQLPSLARCVPGNDRYVERFELYIGGLELANAFTELNDPVEQGRRFETQRELKILLEGYPGGVDEALLAALAYGMPPSGGIALGVDRLLMLFADAAHIDEVLPFVPLHDKKP